MKHTTLTQHAKLAASLAVTSSLLLTAPLNAQQDEWEWEADDGYHREEWYDPSDWFNEDPAVDYESDWYETASDEDEFEEGVWEDEMDLTDELGYGYPSYDYDTEYVYDEDLDRWEEVRAGTPEEEDRDTDYTSTYLYPAERQIERGSQQQWQEERRQDRGMQAQDMRERRERMMDERMGERRDRMTDEQMRERRDRMMDEQMRERRDRMMAQREQKQRQQQVSTLNGEIAGFRSIQLLTRGGDKVTHTLVRLTLDNGKSTVVDMGPRRNLRDLDLEQGDRVKLQGTYGKLDDRRLFVTRYVTIDDNTVQVSRAVPASQKKQQREERSQQMRQRDRQMVLRGEVEDFSKISLKGEESPHTLVKLRMEDGRVATINIGRETSLEDLKLGTGDRIVVKGPRGTINGRTVLMAQSVRVEGTKVKSKQEGS